MLSDALEKCGFDLMFDFIVVRGKKDASHSCVGPDPADKTIRVGGDMGRIGSKHERQQVRQKVDDILLFQDYWRPFLKICNQDFSDFLI